MTEIERATDQLRRAYEGEAWHGPALREVLAGVTAEQAAARPIAAAHTIWEIVHHLAAWEHTVARRLGGEAVHDPPEGDWPPVTRTGEEAWRAALDWLERGHRTLLAAVAALDDEGLERIPVPGGRATAYMQLHGSAQHHLYHAGQIAVLKKA
jgi:uncharacterized damage-inducible protein DinB